MALYNIFKTTNVTMLTKVILESPYKVLQMPSKINTLKRLLHASRFTNRSNFFFLVFIFSFFFFLSFFFFFFCKVQLRLSKQGKNHIPATSQKEIMVLQKFLKILFFAGLFQKIAKFQRTKFYILQKYGKRYSTSPQNIKSIVFFDIAILS